MANGLPRTERYKNLDARAHLAALDDDLDRLDYGREVLLAQLNEAAEKRYEHLSTKLTWVLTTFVSLILLVCGTLLAVVIKT